METSDRVMGIAGFGVKQSILTILWNSLPDSAQKSPSSSRRAGLCRLSPILRPGIGTKLGTSLAFTQSSPRGRGQRTAGGDGDFQSAERIQIDKGKPFVQTFIWQQNDVYFLKILPEPAGGKAHSF